MDATATRRVVLVHDWLTGMRGGEKCLEVACRRWPEAELLTLLHKPGAVSHSIERLRPRASLLNSLPGVHGYYRFLLPLLPVAASAWRVPPCDMVLSFSHCVAKNARPPIGVPHVCYCFTPMRYAWHMREAYFADRTRGLKARFLDRVLGALRTWDRRTAANVTHFLAISKTVQRRIADCYDRDSTVIHPPVDTDFYSPAPGPRDNFYLVVSAFAPYKRIDLALTACRQLGRRLVVIGAGQDAGRLRKLAGANVEFLGWQPDWIIRDMLRRCRALLFPGEEDFGIVPVEAMACGAPVIAYGRGGATETIIPAGGTLEPTGIWFAEQSADCLLEALREFEIRGRDFDPVVCRRQALRFTAARFRQELFAYTDNVLHEATATRRAA